MNVKPHGSGNWNLMRVAARVLGYALVLGSVGFVAQRLHAHLFELRAVVGWDLAVWLATCTLAYAASLHALSLAWSRLLSSLGHPPLPAATWHAIYGRTSIARYLPGNVFHFVGRHLLARRLGVPDSLLAVAAVYELLGLAAAASLLAVLGAGSFPAANLPFGPWTAVGLAVLLLLALLAVARALPVLLSRFGKASAAPPPPSLHDFLGCLVLYLVFVATSVSIAFALAARAHPGAPPWLSIPAYAAAWLAGFALPGAPSGLGVREAVFILLVEPTLGAVPGLETAIAMRVVTTLGDLLFFAASFAWYRVAPVEPRLRGLSGLDDPHDEGR